MVTRETARSCLVTSPVTSAAIEQEIEMMIADSFQREEAVDAIAASGAATSATPLAAKADGKRKHVCFNSTPGDQPPHPGKSARQSTTVGLAALLCGEGAMVAVDTVPELGEPASGAAPKEDLAKVGL